MTTLTVTFRNLANIPKCEFGSNVRSLDIRLPSSHSYYFATTRAEKEEKAEHRAWLPWLLGVTHCSEYRRLNHGNATAKEGNCE